LLAREYFLRPEGVSPGNAGQDAEIPSRRRRRRGPFQGAAVPRIPGDIAEFLATLNRHDELHDLTDDTGENNNGTSRSHQEPRLPGDDVVVLQAPRHAHQADHIERHEGEVKTDEPAPERTPAPAFVERETERLREPIDVAGEGAEHDAGDDDVMKV